MLEHIRVIDLSTDVAGAYGAKLLAAFGADVIKVEPPGGDPTRQLNSIEPGNPDAGILFAYVNANKRGVVLDAGDPADHEQLCALLRRADVIIESGAPGEWATRGVDFASLLEERRSLLICSVTPFGQNGPRAHWRTTALTAFAAGGQMMLCGDPDKPPLKTAGHQAYYQAGLHVFASCATALFAVQRTGQGDWLDISIQEAQFACLEGAGPAAMTRGSDSERTGNQLRATWGVYPCADGFVGVAAMARQTPTVYACIGHPELSEDPANLNLLAYPENNELVAALIGEWVSERTARQVYEDSGAFRAPFSLIPTPANLLTWGPLRERGFWREVDHPVLGRHSMPAAPFAIDGDRGISSRAPLLGEHTDEVLAELITPPTTHEVSPRNPSGPPAPLLDGIRVLDLTQVWAGPYCTRFFGDMGADVIHIEGPRFPDAVRAVGAPPGDRGYDRSSYFNEYNRNKRGLVMDLRDPRGHAAFLRMVEHADIVIENWSTGVADGLGIGYETLRAINPRIVMVQMPGFSESGEEASRVGFGPTIEQMGGLVALQGYEGEQPHKSGISYGDPVGGTAAAGATALALLRRERTGEGSRVIVYQRDNLLGMVGEYMLAESIGHPIPSRIGNHDSNFAPHGVYRTSDDEGRVQIAPAGGVMQEYHDTWLALAVDSDAAWSSLCGVIGDPRLGQAVYATLEGRRAHAAAIDAIISEWAASRDAESCAWELQAAGVSAMPVMSALMLVRDPHMNAREVFQPISHPAAGDVASARPVWRLAYRPLAALQPAPTFGQHNREVLRELAGLSDAHIEEMARDNAIATAPI
ncbi:CoA transferase [bacterium]|nr:CoA transferase [bacterium]